MKRVVSIVSVVLTLFGFLVANQALSLADAPPANSATAVMDTANQLYEAGQYSQAAQAYRQLVDQGYTGAALFYNLGNACFKQADYGRAILYYRRAQRLAPRDPDITANLALARERAVDEYDATGDGGFLSQLGKAVQRFVTLDELALAALGAWVLFMFLLLLLALARKGSVWRTGLQYALALAAVLLVVVILSLGSSLYLDHNHPQGVVVAAQVNITSGPGGQYVTEFTLHSGAEVELVEQRGSWVRLSLPDGELEGWVPANAVESVSG